MLKLHHYSIEVTDVYIVKAFYISLLGFTEDEKVEFAGEEILFLRNGDFLLELIEVNQAESPPGNVHLCFETKNINDIMEKFLKAGIAPNEGPYILKNGWKTVFYRGHANEILEFLEP
ncbi:VOC family protein [Paenibacillus sp. BSR1-1]|uniref:VOC family protein n=1 Tax=Paenibacillus sp. BSR1-1 TaxID=3020845 RepID=UPI0025B1E5CA|nr:VOC family protein [Paenibacillus sp. BSR1-1]MDN3018713.1 VOC family protein [Paenibacillus sp. BSR1-1]